MANFKQDIIEAVGDDTPTIIVIHKTETWYKDPKYKSGDSFADVSLTYEFGLDLLDYDYDAGYGAQDCHDILIWSNNWVYYIEEYDGATYVNKIPRTPPPLIN
jgi:hypothetical protein